MRHMTRHLILCALLLGIVSTLTSASVIFASIDQSMRSLPVTLTARDAEVTDVLNALFAATNNKYRLQTGLGIHGNIAAIHLTAQPFDDALQTILTRANADYQFTKLSGGIYRVFTPNAETITVPQLKMLNPTDAQRGMEVIKVMLPPIEKIDKTKDGNGNTPSPSNPAGIPMLNSPLIGGNNGSVPAYNGTQPLMIRPIAPAQVAPLLR